MAILILWQVLLIIATTASTQLICRQPQQSEYLENDASYGGAADDGVPFCRPGDRDRRDLATSARFLASSWPEIALRKRAIMDPSDMLVHPGAFKSGLLISQSRLNVASIAVIPEVRPVNATGITVHQIRDFGSYTIVPPESPEEIQVYQGFQEDREFIDCRPSNLTTRPTVNVTCGEHVIFAGDHYRLLENEYPCVWNFRFTADSLYINVNLEGGYIPPNLMVKKKERVVRYHFNSNINKTKDAVFNDVSFHPRGRTSQLDIATEICVKDEEFPLAEYSRQYTEGRSIPCGRPVLRADPRARRFLWQMVIKVKERSESPAETEMLCTGALISPRWVLTRAHCFSRIRTNEMPYVVAFFSVSFPNSREHFHVTDVIVYPTFSSDTDVALIKLATPARRSPICLPYYKNPQVNVDIFDSINTVIGWRANGDEGLFLSSLLKLRERVQGPRYCSVKRGQLLPRHILCSQSRAGHSECVYDPYLLSEVGDRYVLRGLPTIHAPCRQGMNLYTSVAHFMPWISHVTGIQVPAYYHPF